MSRLRDALEKWDGDITLLILHEPITTWSSHEFSQALAMLALKMVERMDKFEKAIIQLGEHNE